MATKCIRLCARPTTSSQACKRTFFSAALGLNQPSKLTVERRLNYPKCKLFSIISDIDSYHKFIPYCVDSKITEKKDGLPSRANLRVGFKAYDETFASQVRCIKHDRVEAVSTHPSFERLITAWRLQEISPESCIVHLEIDYSFTNPLYSAVSAAVVPKLADQVITAFEDHAKRTLLQA